MSFGLTSAITNLHTAETVSRIQMAVAARMLQTANAQGEAVVSLIESAAETMEQAAAQVASAAPYVGSNLDVVG